MKREHLRDHAYSALARRNLILAAAMRSRQVATDIIGKRLASSTLPELNGELWFASLVAAQVRIAIDIGANVGDWSAFALDRFPNLTHLIAYEPGEVAAILAAQIGTDTRVTIVNSAVSDTCGTVRFAENHSDNKLSSAVAGTTAARDVSCVRVDDELTARGLDHVDFVKIDVEGLDLHVLRGARESLTKGRIEVVQFEYGPTWQQAGSTLSAAFRLLEGCGYTVLLVTPGALRAFSPDEIPELFTYANFVALRDQMLDHVRPVILPGW